MTSNSLISENWIVCNVGTCETSSELAKSWGHDNSLTLDSVSSPKFLYGGSESLKQLTPELVETLAQRKTLPDFLFHWFKIYKTWNCFVQWNFTWKSKQIKLSHICVNSIEGASWSPEAFLGPQASFKTIWCACIEDRKTKRKQVTEFI